MRKDLQNKIKQAIRLIQSAAVGGGYIEVAYSGGKDSDVILQLTKEAGVNYRAIYKNTTIDPPGTIRHVKEMGAEILMPKTTFFDLMRKNGSPNRFSRFCCRILKEYKVLDKAIIGVRKSESTSRAKRYSEPTQCRYYGAKKPENHVEQIFPILEWTDEDILDFITDRKLKLAPIYYGEDGTIHIERRLGCMCCPMLSEGKRIEQFKQHPKMALAYIKAMQTRREAKPNSASVLMHDDVYEQFTHDVYYPRKGKEWATFKTTLPMYPRFKEFLEEDLGIDLTLSKKGEKED